MPGMGPWAVMMSTRRPAYRLIVWSCSAAAGSVVWARLGTTASVSMGRWSDTPVTLHRFQVIAQHGDGDFSVSGSPAGSGRSTDSGTPTIPPGTTRFHGYD